jgi:hypothetical protein
VQTCKKLLSYVWKSDVPFILKVESTAHLTSNFAYLFLILMCFLVWPDAGQAVVKGPQDSWSVLRFWLLDIPVFIMTTGSVCLFYLTAQRYLFPKTWWKQMGYLPPLLALGVGMSINNGKAVLEAIFNQESPFVRTPKYGIETKQDKWKSKKKYKAMKSLATILEILLAIYFTGLTIYYILNNNWPSVLFMGLFMLGFWYVAVGSLPMPNRSDSPEKPAPAA